MLDFGINFGFTIPSWVPEIGGKKFAVNIPDAIPDARYLARGGMIANQATAIVGEGRKGYPEYVIPTDPAYRANSMRLLMQLIASLGLKDMTSAVPRFATGGIFGTTSYNAPLGSSGSVYHDERRYSTYNFYGDLEFPNVKSGDDAKEFLDNLESLV